MLLLPYKVSPFTCCFLCLKEEAFGREEMAPLAPSGATQGRPLAVNRSPLSTEQVVEEVEEGRGATGGWRQLGEEHVMLLLLLARHTSEPHPTARWLG